MPWDRLWQGYVSSVFLSFLETYDGEELPNWHYGITLNTIDAPAPPCYRRPEPDEVALWHRQRSNPHGRTMLDCYDIDNASRACHRRGRALFNGLAV